MNTVERVLCLAKERGVSQTYIINRLGLKSRTYFNDIQKRGGEIPAERIALIAQILDTTVDYLLGRTDQKEKPAENGELSEVQADILKRIMALSPEKRKQMEDYIDFLLTQQGDE